jgi:hypothetical protein
LFASVVTSAGLTLPLMKDPNNSSNTIAECLPFVDGYVWGAVATGTLQIAGEQATSMPIHIMDDNSSFAPAVPSGCTKLTSPNNETSIAIFGANGIIGVGLAATDCGSVCANCTSMQSGCTSANDNYYSCGGTSNQCNPAEVALTSQVVNPVALFATDNNGVLLTLPAISSAGAATATGTLTFGIGTQTNNALGSAFVLNVSDQGFFNATISGQSALASSFIDSGSSAYFFDDSALTKCPPTSSSSSSSSSSGGSGTTFFCQNPTATVSVNNQSETAGGSTTGSTSTVNILIADANQLNGSFTAFDDLGATQVTSTGTDTLNNDFDFGLPFFYGRTVYTGIAGMAAVGVTGVTGPYFAY